MPLRIISWNINSVRLRMPLVKQLAEQQQPDIICLQETKVADESFPLDDLKAIGFTHTVFSGEKSYNGVAILSRIPLGPNGCTEFGGRPDKRHICVRLPDGTELHNFYVPAGGDEPDVTINPKFDHKLRFVDDMTAYFATHKKSNDNIIMVGDMNIAPLEHDVWSHKQLLTVVSHTPIEVEKMEKLRASLSWVDTHRHFTPAHQKLYSWWSYRNRDWEKSNRGRRLDHIWVTPAMQPRLLAAHTLRDARNWQQPSDHVPIVTDFAG